MKKVLFSFLASLLFLTIILPSANAENLNSSKDNIIIKQDNVEELNELVVENQDLIVPLSIPLKPGEENFGGVAGGFNVMSKSTATSYVKSHGYKDVHDFKYEYLGRSAPIDHYDLYYTKGSVRYVYILRKGTTIGTKAYETYN